MSGATTARANLQSFEILVWVRSSERDAGTALGDDQFRRGGSYELVSVFEFVCGAREGSLSKPRTESGKLFSSDINDTRIYYTRHVL